MGRDWFELLRPLADRREHVFKDSGKKEWCFTQRMSKKVNTDPTYDEVWQPGRQNRINDFLIAERLAERKQRVVDHEPK